MQDFVQLLITKFVQPQFAAGVHVFVDNPGTLPETPKETEQSRREQEHQVLTANNSAALSTFLTSGSTQLTVMQKGSYWTCYQAFI